MTEQPRRLRRSPERRILAGVCSGLAEFTGIDPIVYRVAFGILVLSGGSGILLYIAAALLMPPAHGGPSWAEKVLRRAFDGGTALALVGVLALVGAGLSLLGHWHNTDAVGLVVVVALIGFVAHSRGIDLVQVARTLPERLQGMKLGDVPRQPPAGDLSAGMIDLARLSTTHTDMAAPASMPTAPAVASETPAATVPIEPDDPWSTPAADDPTVDLAAPRPAAAVPGPPVSPAKCGTSLLFPVFFGLAMLAGSLSVSFTGHHSVALRVEVAAAVALMVTALGIIVGTRFGRTGGLVFVAALLSLTLAGSVAARDPALRGAHGTVAWHPTATVQAENTHKVAMGDGMLDLTDVPLRAGERLNVPISVTLGRVRVMVPRTARLEVRGRSTLGDITVDGAITSGPRAQVDATYLPEGKVTGTAPIIELDILCRLGDVEVNRV